jgi:hypothetical protein
MPRKEEPKPVIMDINHSFYYAIVNNTQKYKLFEGFYVQIDNKPY